MTTAVRVLIAEADKKWAEYIKSIVEFMGLEPVVLNGSGPGPGQNGGSETPLLALFGPSCSEPVSVEMFRQMRARYPALPVVLAADKAARASIPPDLLREAAATIDVPLRHDEIVGILEDMQAGHAARSRRNPELFRCLVGDSASVVRVRRLIEQVADTDANVLILGESGTGKEVVARNIHYHSARRDRPFVRINCGAIPTDLLESELFGYEKDGSLAVVGGRQGRFEIAEGGTLFLGEIGDMSAPMQVKLLRVLQERSFERVGGNRRIRADVRIIAATHRNLEEAIREGRFREDLYYRLNVFPIEMPPLRARREDVPLLVEELLRRYQHEKRIALKLTHAAVQALSAYHWPGNVRELANLIERLAILHPNGLVDLHELPQRFRGGAEGPLSPLDADDHDVEALPVHPLSLPRIPRGGIRLKQHLNSLELNLIKQALEETGGVVAHAAQRLGLRRTTLVEKLRKYGLHRSENQASGF